MSVGKKLKKVKLTLTRDDDSIWTSSFDADTFVFGSFKLPEGEELNTDEIFADRMRELATFRAVFIEYFKLFANAMLNEPEKTRNAMREWMQQREAI